jgi:CBS domain containing-hemolysin-like protein
MGWIFLAFFGYTLCLLAERALVNVSAQDAEQLVASEDAAARRARQLLQRLKPALAALLLARVLLVVLTVVGTMAWVLRAQAVRDALAAWAQRAVWPDWAAWGGAAALLSFAFAVAFWAAQKLGFQKIVDARAGFLLQRLSWFVIFWETIFYPFVKKEKPLEPLEQEISEELSSTPSTAANSEKRELEMLKSIVRFGDVTVKQVMQPRSKVVAVDFRTEFQELLATVRATEFSRLPVYDGDLDNVMGILYVKDLVPHLDAPDDFEWQPLVRTNVLMVPEAKRGSELLQEFKQQRLHMAIVVDEYGGSEGIVTLEDILEEVTGDIRDEFDEESDVRYRKLDDHTYLFEGTTLLNDVCRLAGLDAAAFDAARGNADTLAGLALELRGDIPKVGTEIAWGGYLLSIVAADNRRIEQIKLTLPHD